MGHVQRIVLESMPRLSFCKGLQLGCGLLQINTGNTFDHVLALVSNGILHMIGEIKVYFKLTLGLRHIRWVVRGKTVRQNARVGLDGRDGEGGGRRRLGLSINFDLRR